MTQIQQYREKRGWTRAELAKRAGITARTVLNLETEDYGRRIQERIRTAIVGALRVGKTKLFLPDGRVR